jgi:hypothetical protein
MFELFSNTKARQQERETIQEMFNKANNKEKEHKIKSNGQIIRK